MTFLATASYFEKPPARDRDEASPTRVSLAGGRMDLVTPAEVLAFAARRAARGGKAYIANHNAHSLSLLPRSAEMRAAYAEADLIEVDSVPLIFWGRLLGLPIQRRHRCTYLDWRDEFWRMAAAHRWRVYMLGAAPGVAERAAERLRQSWPGVVIITRHGHFDLDDAATNEAIVAEINLIKPHAILVGMGMPRQETWVARCYARLQSGVVFTVGGAFDYEAGVQVPAPRWLGPLGLEWLFRLACNPGRLAHRYLVEPWSLVPAMAKDVAASLRGRVLKA